MIGAFVGGLVILIPAVEQGNPVLLALALIPAGLLIAPIMAGVAMVVIVQSPESRRSESFGWVNSAKQLGVGIAMPITGVMLDGPGPGVALLVGVGAACTAGAASLVAGRRGH